MKFIKSFITTLSLAAVLTGCSLPFVGSKKAALQVTSLPKATVFLDSKHVGQTPFFDENLKPGEYTLRLVPEDSAGVLLSWETKIKLTPQILTVVNREINVSDAESSGEILTLEPLSSKTKTTLAIISIPDSAIVKLNGQPKGFTPVSVDDVAPGEQTITLSAPGFKEKIIKAKTTAGHKLTISVQLAKESLIAGSQDKVETDPGETASTSKKPQPSPSPEPEETETKIASASASTTKKPYVEILDNSLGYLRIRKEPTTGSAEIARASLGQKLPYLQEEENGWYQITYATGKSGWVSRGASGEYAKLVE